METLDKIYEKRRDLQIKAEALGKGDECWQRLGVAHRHLERIENGELHMVPGVEHEIEKCLDDVTKWLNEKENP